MTLSRSLLSLRSLFFAILLRVLSPIWFSMEPNQPATYPYTLSSSDHLGLVLVSHPLTEENYNSWSRAMRMALNGKRKLGFVDGSIPRPGDDATPDQIANWQCVNDVVSSWLLNSISKDIAATIIYCESAAAIWSALKDMFQHGNGPRIFELKHELVNFRQGTMSIT